MSEFSVSWNSDTRELVLNDPTPLCIFEPGRIGPQPTPEAIEAFARELAQRPQVDLPPRHFFAKGMYGRWLEIPAGVEAVGKVHRHEHLVMLMTGTAAINTDRGMELITGPHVWTSQPGAQRALKAVTDCVFFTCHLNPSDTTDLAALEAEIIVPKAIGMDKERLE